MKQADVLGLLAQHPNEVWSVLLKNGLELVTQMRTETVRVFDGMGDPQKDLLLSKPMHVRPIHIPMQTGGNINVQTSAQQQPLMMLMVQPELPVEATEIWFMTTATKQVSDHYLQQTSSILIGRH